MYQTFTANLVGAQKRYDTINGRKHLVLPTVMLTEGVHTGNNGPLLYRGTQLSRNLPSWNHKPVVIEHPTFNGVGITACQKEILESQSVGILLNSGYDGRLKTETWAEDERLHALAPDVHAKVLKGLSVEVSTGLNHELDITPGTWNGEAYRAEVINMIGDHLAILTKGKGACSVEKGAGLLVNADGTSGELSYNDIRDQIKNLLQAPAVPPPGMPPSSYPYVCDLYKSYAIVEAGEDLWKVYYKVSKGKVVLTQDAPEQVQRTISYVANSEDFPLSRSVTGDTIAPNRGPQDSKPQETTVAQTQNTNPAPGTPHPRKSAIDAIIAAGGAEEKDRGILEGLPDPVFKLTEKGAIPPAAVVPPAPPVQQTPPPVVPAAAPATPVAGAVAQNQAMTPQQWLDSQPNMPPQIKQYLAQSLATQNAQQEAMISTILAAPGNRFTKEWLMVQDPAVLQGLSGLIQNQQPTAPPTLPSAVGYGGQGLIPILQMPTAAAQSTQNANQPPVLSSAPVIRNKPRDQKTA